MTPNPADIRPGTVLTAADPEPPEYTVVETRTGSLWISTPGPLLGSEIVDTWRKFIAEHGPVTVVLCHMQ
jgi:hypothetical protein